MSYVGIGAVVTPRNLTKERGDILPSMIGLLASERGDLLARDLSISGEQLSGMVVEEKGKIIAELFERHDLCHDHLGAWLLQLPVKAIHTRG